MTTRYGALAAWRGRPQPVEMPQGGPSDVRHARYLVTEDGAQRFTRISMTQINGWTIMLRFSANPEDADAADAVASQMFVQAVEEVMTGPPSR